eukprot:scaffold81315_cov20-Tisochrysis_lutea.AAC.1
MLGLQRKYCCRHSWCGPCLEVWTHAELPVNEVTPQGRVGAAAPRAWCSLCAALGGSWCRSKLPHSYRAHACCALLLCSRRDARLFCGRDGGADLCAVLPAVGGGAAAAAQSAGEGGLQGQPMALLALLSGGSYATCRVVGVEE